MHIMEETKYILASKRLLHFVQIEETNHCQTYTLMPEILHQKVCQIGRELIELRRFFFGNISD